jgi:hypothetical protein
MIVRVSVIVPMTLFPDERIKSVCHACTYAPVVEQAFLKQDAENIAGIVEGQKACCAFKGENNHNSAVQEGEPGGCRCDWAAASGLSNL